MLFLTCLIINKIGWHKETCVARCFMSKRCFGSMLQMLKNRIFYL